MPKSGFKKTEGSCVPPSKGYTCPPTVTPSVSVWPSGDHNQGEPQRNNTSWRPIRTGHSSLAVDICCLVYSSTVLQSQWPYSHFTAGTLRFRSHRENAKLPLSQQHSRYRVGFPSLPLPHDVLLDEGMCTAHRTSQTVRAEECLYRQRQQLDKAAPRHPASSAPTRCLLLGALHIWSL